MPAQDHLPQHIAIVMDGNGRWAERQRRPRSMGHQAGVQALKNTLEHCVRKGIQLLTVFAFSSENWNRPKREISRLMELFMRALDKEVSVLNENNIRICFIGDRGAFHSELQQRMEQAETLTALNTQMTLIVAANYGGRWDIVETAKKLARSVQNGRIKPEEIDEQLFNSATATANLVAPDLFIRTGGEMRISNFLLWQCAYSEFYFSPVLWPDFDAAELDRAIASFQTRERRFGLTGEQLKGSPDA